ncbi:MAG: cysteine synthase A [Epulopiscium sp. Nele67-Bin005]|nr:MAG: cysteine synthase A [Epulopiscium sp. Nele67-Bin005]
MLEFIGNTPLVKVSNLSTVNPNIYLKLEKNNPSGSVKDRAVYFMINELEKQQKIERKSTLIEASSGNTGISLSMIGSLKGYRVLIVMPENMSQERQTIMKAYGAELVLTDKALGMKGAIDKMNELCEQNPDYVQFGQFTNSANVMAHYETTAQEILRDLPNIDIFVAGVGTGGTITGVGTKLKETNSKIKIIALEPAKSPVISGGQKGPHGIQGIGAGFIPDILDTGLIDEVITIEEESAHFAMKFLAKNCGILAGISSGANVHGATIIAERYKTKNVATVICDGYDKYMSLEIL